MFLRNDDVYATHVVVSASLRLLVDLKRKTGPDFLDTAPARGLFALGRDYLAGMLPEPERNDPYLLDIAKKIACEIENGSISSWKDIKVSGKDKSINAEWKKITNNYNFLKHADRNSEETIEEGGIDNFDLLFKAAVAFVDAFSGQTTIALNCFRFFHTWRSDGTRREWMEPFFRLASDMDEGQLKAVLAGVCLNGMPV